VEPRREQKADVITVERLSGEAGGFDKRLNADEFRRLQSAESERGEDAVFADEGDDVGDRSQRGESGRFEQIFAEFRRDLRISPSRRNANSPRKLERDAGAAERG